jgi:hypothetical protein
MRTGQIENFTIASNGRGAHTIKAAKHVHDELTKAYATEGAQGVKKTLARLADEMSVDHFY